MFKKKYKRTYKSRKRGTKTNIIKKKKSKRFSIKNKLKYLKKKQNLNNIEKKKRKFIRRLGEKKLIVYKGLITKLKKIKKTTLRKPILKRIYRLLKKKRLKKLRLRGYKKRNTYKPWHKFWRGLCLPKLKKRIKIYKLKKGIFHLSNKLKHNHIIFKSSLHYMPPMISHDILSKKNRYSRIIMLHNFSKLARRSILLKKNKKQRLKQIKKLSLKKKYMKRLLYLKHNLKQNIPRRKANKRVITYTKKYIKNKAISIKKLKGFLILKNKQIKLRKQKVISSVILRKKNRNVPLKNIKINNKLKSITQSKKKDSLQQNEHYISYLKDTLKDFFEIKENILLLEKSSQRTKLFSDLQKEIETIQEMQKIATPLNIRKRPFPIIKKTNQKVQSLTFRKHFLRQKINNRKTFFYWIQDIFVTRRGIYKNSHSNISSLKKEYLILKKKYNILKFNQLKQKKIVQFFYGKNNKILSKKNKKIKYPAASRLKKYKNILKKQLKRESLYKIYFTKNYRSLNKQQRKYIKRKQYRYNMVLKNHKIISNLYKKHRQFRSNKSFSLHTKDLKKKFLDLKKNTLFYKFYLSLYRKAFILQNKKHYMKIQKYSLNKDFGIECLMADF